MRRGRLLHHSLLVAAALASTASIAVAQPAKPGGGGGRTATPEDEARARFNEGVVFAEASDHEAARLKFSQAWALLKSPVILYNLARAEHLSGHPVESLEHYRLFMKMSADPKITERQRQSATDTMNELAKKVGQISVEAPANTRVTIDNRPIDDPTEPIPVSVGKHTVEATVDGKGRTVTVDCTAGTITKAKLTPDEKPTAPPPSHNHNGGGSPGTTAATTIEPPKELPHGFWTTGRVIGAAMGGVGLVGVGLGVVFHIGAGDAETEANALRQSFPENIRNSICKTNPAEPNCVSLKNALDDQTTREGLRTGFFIGGGALLVGGVILFLVAAPAAKSESRTTGTATFQFVPTASPNHAGASVLGTF